MQPSMAAIKAAVAEEWGCSVLDLESPRRAQDCARPRQAAMYLCRRLTTRTTPEIGRAFGDRDHTTVLHACKAVTSRMVFPEEWERINRLSEYLANGNVKSPIELKLDMAASVLPQVDALIEEVDAIQKRLRRVKLSLEEVLPAARRNGHGGH